MCKMCVLGNDAEVYSSKYYFILIHAQLSWVAINSQEGNAKLDFR